MYFSMGENIKILTDMTNIIIYRTIKQSRSFSRRVVEYLLLIEDCSFIVVFSWNQMPLKSF